MAYYDGNTVTALWNYAPALRDERSFLWYYGLGPIDARRP